MPTRPVEFGGNRLLLEAPPLTVHAEPGQIAGTLKVTYKFHMSPIFNDASWNGAVIDTLELLVVPARLTNDDGLQLSEATQVFTTQSVPVRPYSTTTVAGSGSVALPTSFFGYVDMPFVDSRRTWTLLVRTRGSQNLDGTTGSNRVLSSLAIRAEVDGLLGPLIQDAPAD